MSTVRRTSIYSLRVPAAFPSVLLPVLRDMLLRRDTAVLDQNVVREDGRSYAVVGFRAAGDEAAKQLVRSLPLLRPYTLVTGYGMHRREVAL